MADGPLKPLGIDGNAERRSTQLPEMVTGMDSHTVAVTPASEQSKPRRVSSPLQPQRGLLELSDAAEDSSAYAESLEGGGGNKQGVPFYPGMYACPCRLLQNMYSPSVSLPGDKRGPAFLMDICEPHRSSTSNHCVVNMPTTKSLPPEDVEYLRVKGAFILPPRHIQDALVQCYFAHVHPLAPILDPFQFILDYENGIASLLLLWSMFLASASVWWPHLCLVPGSRLTTRPACSSSTTNCSRKTSISLAGR